MWRNREEKGKEAERGGRRDVEKQREGADVMWRSRERRGRRDVEKQKSKTCLVLSGV